MTWLEGFDRAPVAGVAGGSWADVDAVPRIIVHRTEGPRALDALATYRETGFVPHLTVDTLLRTRWQHLPLNRAASAVQNRAGGVETNRAPWTIQVEIVGYSALSRWMTAGELGWLGAHVVAPIVVALLELGVVVPLVAPRSCHDVAELRSADKVPSGGWAGVTLPLDEWYATGGVLGHQHVPENTSLHWDPGALDLRAVVLAAAAALIPPPPPEPTPTPEPEEDDMANTRPILLIFGDQPGDAVFARFDGSTVRHLGGDETSYWRTVQPAIPAIIERDRPGYLRLVAESGTDWRPGA